MTLSENLLLPQTAIGHRPPTDKVAIKDTIIAKEDGIIIGRQNIPLVQEGEALYHIAYFNKPEQVAESLDDLEEQYVAREILL